MRWTQVGAEIVKRALGYPLKLIASNAGVNGSVVMQKVMDQADRNVGYNAATGAYEDLMAAGIIDPTKVAPTTRSSPWNPQAPLSSVHARASWVLGLRPGQGGVKHPCGFIGKRKTSLDVDMLGAYLLLGTGAGFGH